MTDAPGTGHGAEQLPPPGPFRVPRTLPCPPDPPVSPLSGGRGAPAPPAGRSRPERRDSGAGEQRGGQGVGGQPDEADGGRGGRSGLRHSLERLYLPPASAAGSAARLGSATGVAVSPSPGSSLSPLSPPDQKKRKPGHKSPGAGSRAGLVGQPPVRAARRPGRSEGPAGGGSGGAGERAFPALAAAVLPSATRQHRRCRAVAVPLNWSLRDGLCTGWMVSAEPPNLVLSRADPVPPSTQPPSSNLAPQHLCSRCEWAEWFRTAPVQCAARRRFELVSPETIDCIAEPWSGEK